MTNFKRNFMVAVSVAMLTVAPALACAEGVQPQITVTGVGAVSVTPDMARITLGVVQQAETAAAAMIVTSTNPPTYRAR